MTPELVTAIHCVDAAAAAARVHAREERSEAWQMVAVRISGLCAQLVTAASNAGHAGLLAPAERQAGSLAVELARHRIRVNSILPGWIETEMTARAMGDERFSAAVMPRIPARRWGHRDDFGGIAVYLASEASAYHTGEAFVIDGGYTKF